MIDTDEKMHQARALDLARRQAEADAARARTVGVPPNPPTLSDRFDERNPNRPSCNDNDQGD